MQGVVMCDLDGTIYFGERGFAPGLMEVYSQLHESGVVATINTARHARTGRVLAATLGLKNPYACLTGGVILNPPDWQEDDLDIPSFPEPEEVLQGFRMSKRLVVEILLLAASFGIGGRVFYDRDVCLYGKQQVYAQWPEDIELAALDEVQEGALQMFITGYDHRQGDQMAERLQAMGDECSYYRFHHRDGFEIAVNPKGVTKAKLVDYYMQTYPIPREHIVAIGDSPGDAPMIQAAGVGVATALAPDEVKAVADVVLDTPKLNAVPDFLRHYFDL